MKAFKALLKVQTRRNLRDPTTLFFMVAFAPLFAIGMGLLFGNEPTAEFDGRGYLDANLVSFTAIVVTIVGLVAVPTDLVTQRETGALRRFRATPLNPATYIAADVTVRFLISMVGITAMIGIGVIGFGARPTGSLFAVLLAAGLGVVVLLASGYAVSAFLPSQGSAQAVGNILLYPLIFLSGAAVPIEVLPDGVRTVAQFSPVTQFVELLQALWQGQSWSHLWTPLLALAALLAVAVTIALRYFRWE